MTALFLFLLLMIPLHVFYLVEQRDYHNVMQQGIRSGSLARWISWNLRVTESGELELPVDIPKLFAFQRVQIRNSQQLIELDTGWISSEALFPGGTLLPPPEKDMVVQSTDGSVKAGTIAPFIMYHTVAYTVWDGRNGTVTFYSDKRPLLLRKKRIKRLTLLFSLLYAVCAGIGILFFHRRYTLPLLSLSRKVGEGAVETIQKEAERSDEIGALAAAYISAVTRLHRRNASHREFTSDIMHELKNPLGGIRNGLEHLLSREIRSEEKELLQKLVQESGRLELLLSSIHELGSYEAVDYSDQSANVVQVLKNILAFYQDKSLYCSSDLSGKAGLLAPLPPDDLGRALRNLIDNALDFSPGGESVQLSFEKEQNFILIQVKDRGQGIPDAVSKLVYRRFYSRRSEGRDMQHTGLGLAITRRIAEKAGGSLSHSKNTPRGTCFSLRLPIINNY